MKLRGRIFRLFIMVFMFTNSVFISSALAGSTILTSNGIKFPDGTTQSTSANGGSGQWSASGFDIYYNAGKVGVGIASPERTLDVNGYINARNSIIVANHCGVLFKNSDGQLAYLGMRGDNNDDLQLFTNGQERVSIDKTTGFVGIGTLTPYSELEVKGRLYVNNSKNQTAIWVAQDSDTGDIAEFQKSGVVKVLIDNSGNVGIGTTTPSYKLHVNGTAAGTSWTNLSSKEFKEDIRKVVETAYPMMLAKVMDMDITTYNYKDEYGGDGEVKLGFIAEDMPQEVLSKDGKGVDIYELVALTIGAMKAQQKEIQKQKLQNEALKVKLTELMKRFEAFVKFETGTSLNK